MMIPTNPNHRSRQIAHTTIGLICAILLLGCESCSAADAIDPCPSAGDDGVVCFAHLTDPHLFSQKEGDDDVENRAAFLAASKKLSEIPKLDFAVMTGDLEVEELLGQSTLDSEIGKRIKEGAATLEEGLVSSGVKDWLFIPGNNDLIDEFPQSLSYFQQLIDSTRDLVSNRSVRVIDSTRGGRITLGPHAFWGFDNSSFKNIHEGSRALAMADVQVAIIEEFRANLDSSAASNHFAFLHNPDISDPHLSRETENRPVLPGKEQTCQARLESFRPRKPDGHCKMAETLDDTHPAWCASVATLQAWRTLFRGDSYRGGKAKLRGIFAGHLHSIERCDYRIQHDSVFVRSPSPPPIFVAPPLALKHQPRPGRPEGDIVFRADAGVAPSGTPQSMSDDPGHARGFQVVQIDADGRVDQRTIYWYDRENDS